MKLLRYGPAGAEKPGMLDQDGAIRCLAGVVRDIDGFALSPASLKMLAGINPMTSASGRGQSADRPLRGAAGELHLHRAELCRSCGGSRHAGAEGADHIPQVAGGFLRSER